MNEPRRPDSAAPPTDAPPPSPWWSRTQDDATTSHDQWGAPTPAPTQPSYGERPYSGAAGESAFGDAAYGAPPVAPDDPWSRPTTRATFASGAQPWGPLTDTIGGSTSPAASRRRGQLGLAGAVLATALIAGGTGGYLGAQLGDGGELLDPGASLGSPSTSSASVDRAPESVAGIAATVMRSTVSIAVRGGGSQGTGSGVVIRDDGYILTNNHVVEAGDVPGGEVTVVFDGAEREIPAQIVGRDPVTDLAVLQIKAGQKVPAAVLGNSGALVVGDPVIAIGSPLGLSGTVTTGIVSALNRTVNVPAEGGQSSNPLFNAIQTDAAINPGNSGGALVNGKGEVIGINSAIATLGGSGLGDPSGSIGVGFAIPVDEARSVAEEIIRTGRATHPSIGVSATTVSSEQSDRRGALVRELTTGGAASKAGLEEGDLITKVGDSEVGSVDELILAIRSNKIGDTVSVGFVRSGQERTLEVVLQDLQRN